MRLPTAPPITSASATTTGQLRCGLARHQYHDDREQNEARRAMNTGWRPGEDPERRARVAVT